MMFSPQSTPPSVSALRRSRMLRTLDDVNDDTRDVLGWVQGDAPGPIVDSPRLGKANTTSTSLP